MGCRKTQNMELKIELENIEQKEMLDYMWNELDSEDDFMTWFYSLDEKQQEMAMTLKELLLIAITDSQVEKSDMSESFEILSEIGKRRSGG